MVEEMVARANGDERLRARGKFIDLAFELGVGGDTWIIRIDKGHVAASKAGPGSPKPQFSIRAGDDAWADFRKPVPPPGTHDILALFEGERLEIDGDILPLMQNLMFIKLVLDKARHTGAAA
jgi:hypothetical protein